MENWVELKVIEKKKWNDTLFSLQIQTDGRKFNAGQFTKIGFVDPNNADNIISRAYSYVNSSNQDFLEFCLIDIPDGLLSNYLTNIKAGDSLLISTKSTGFMVLAEIPDNSQFTSFWMLATGTAIGPFISILRQGEVQKRFTNIILAHAVRYTSDLTYKAEIKQMQQDFPNLHYAPFVSREDVATSNEEDSKPFLSGRIPAAITSKKLQQYVNCDLCPDSSQVMLCGNPDMIKDTTDALIEMKFSRNRRKSPGNITTEQYWSAS